MSSEMYSILNEFGEHWEKEIGGVDSGFGSMLVISDYAILLKDGNKPIGFLLGSKCLNNIIEEEKTFCLTAAYLVPEYRNKGGKHKDVLKTSLEGLIEVLDENGFDRLNVIPDTVNTKGIVTEIGEKHVLRPFYYILQEKCDRAVEGFDEKTKNQKGNLRNMGSSQLHRGFNPIWLFHPEDYLQKVESKYGCLE